MFASLGLTVSGLIFCLLIAIVYFSKRKYTNFEDKVYKFELILTIIMFFVEIGCVFTIHYREYIPIFNKILCNIYNRWKKRGFLLSFC